MARIYLRLDVYHTWMLHLYMKQKTKVLGIYSFNTPILLLKDLNLIKQATIKQFDHFTDHRQVVSEDTDPLFGKCLFALKGAKWRKMRLIVSPTFTSSKMKSMFVLVSNCAAQLNQYFLNDIGDKKILDVELKDIFTRFANDVIAITAFGIECNSWENKENEFYLMGKNIANVNFRQPSKFFTYYVNKYLMRFFKITMYSNEASQFFQNIIKTSAEVREKEGIVRADMIHLLLEARKQKQKQENGEICFGSNTNIDLSYDDTTAQVLLFLLAGFDTIFKVISLMAYELAQHADIQERLQAEVDDALETGKGNISYKILMKMKYLDMVLNETLRKWTPTAALDRKCTEPFTIKAEDVDGQDIYIEKDSLILIPIYAIHHDPEYYPDPDKFDPERFNKEENNDKLNPMAYLPFGVGPRSCIGTRFALMEMKTIFVHILSKFSIVLTPKSKVPLKLKTGNFSLNIPHDLWVGLVRRNKK